MPRDVAQFDSCSYLPRNSGSSGSFFDIGAPSPAIDDARKDKTCRLPLSKNTVQSIGSLDWTFSLSRHPRAISRVLAANVENATALQTKFFHCACDGRLFPVAPQSV